MPLLRTRSVPAAVFAVVCVVLGLNLGGCPATPQNTDPVANAGADQTVNTGAAVTLNGAASSDADGDTLTFQWAQTAGTPTVPLSGANTSVATFTAPSSAAALVFTLTVNDGRGGTATDSVTINVTAGGGSGNLNPTANAGPDQPVEAGAAVTLTGSGTDLDNDPLTFAWTQTAGTIVTLTNANAATATFTAPSTEGTLTFQLMVNDGRGGTATDDVSVFVHVPTLFVANFNAGTVVSFANPATVNGNITPTTDLAGAATLLSQTWETVVDKDGALLASNFGNSSVTVYNGALTVSLNTAPSRNVQGGNTTLNNPTALAIDRTNDVLFVASFAGNAILIYPNVSQNSFNGNLAPTRTITTTGVLSQPRGLALDAAGSLYVANTGGNNVLVYANAANLTGNVAASRTLTSAAFTGVFDVFIDGQGNLLTVNFGATVNTFTNAPGLNNAITPNFTLTVPGATNLTGLAVDSQGRGYLADFSGNKIFSYDGISTLNGTVAAPRTIAGANTQLSGPIGLFMLD